MVMNKKILFIFAPLVFLVVVLAIIFFSNKSVTTGIDIYSLPPDSQLLLDGKTISSGKNSTTTGKHTIEARHDHFDTLSKKVEVIKNQVLVVPMALSPKDDTGKTWYENHQDDYLSLEATISSQYRLESSKITKMYPIVADLPQDISPLYRIDYGVSKRYPNDPTRIALYISSNTPANKYDAIRYIYLMGYDPSDYEIIFEGL